MTIKQIIDDANVAYYKSVDVNELKGHAAKLTKAVQDRYIDDNNLHNGSALLIRIMVKFKALAYFQGGYDKADYDELVTYIDYAAKVAAKNGYKKSELLCNEVLTAANAINSVFFDAYAQKCRLCDDSGNRVAQTCEECAGIREIFETKKSAVGEMEFNPKPFGDGVVFGDIKEQAIADLEEIVQLCGEFSEAIKNADAGKMLEECSEDLTYLKSAANEYYPRNDMIERSAKALVVSTPFKEELQLFASKYAGGDNLYLIHIGYFDDRQPESLQLVLNELARRKADCVIDGIYNFRGDRTYLYRALMTFGKQGRHAFIWDKKSARTIYDEALKAVGGGLDILDISFTYLSMPDFKDVIELFEQEKMLSNGVTFDDVRQNCRYMGFEGLNKAVLAYKNGKTDNKWYEIAKDFSRRRESAAADFLRHISNTALFIDSGWGVEIKRVKGVNRQEFDYDDIKVSNPNNIRKIMIGDYTLFQKCGLIARYCTLHNQDISRWKDIDAEERSARITEATQLVMRALDVGIKPVVELVEEDGSPWGGLCCDGGKRILYKTRCSDDYEWMVDAICHECFHAFQHKAENEGFTDWFWTELGVTEGRIHMWAYNFKHYKDIPKRGVQGSPYMIQIVECDARAFAEDCLNTTESLISTIDFE